MARAVGVDLGTTNSVVSVLEAGEPDPRLVRDLPFAGRAAQLMDEFEYLSQTGGAHRLAVGE